MPLLPSRLSHLAEPIVWDIEGALESDLVERLLV
jgi:hypothetical protein